MQSYGESWHKSALCFYFEQRGNWLPNVGAIARIFEAIREPTLEFLLQKAIALTKSKLTPASLQP